MLGGSPIALTRASRRRWLCITGRSAPSAGVTRMSFDSLRGDNGASTNDDATGYVTSADVLAIGNRLQRGWARRMLTAEVCSVEPLRVTHNRALRISRWRHSDGRPRAHPWEGSVRRVATADPSGRWNWASSFMRSTMATPPRGKTGNSWTAPDRQGQAILYVFTAAVRNELISRNRFAGLVASLRRNPVRISW